MGKLRRRMEELSRTKGRSYVLLSWWLSYGVVILLPMVITAFVFTGVLSAYESDTRSANAAVLSIIGREVDAFFASADSVINEILLDTSIAQVKYIRKESIDAQFRYRLWRIISTQIPRYSLNNQVLNLFIYLPNSDMFLSAHRYRSAREAFEEYFFDSGLDYETFGGYLSQSQLKAILPMPDEDCKYFLYMNSRFFSQGGDDLKVILMASSGIIDGIIGGVDWIDQSVYFAFNKQNELVMSNADAVLRARILSDPDLQGGAGEVMVDGVSYIVQRGQEDTRLHYLYLVPRSALFSKVTASIRAALLAYLACVTLGFAIAALLIKRNYRPIAGILNHIAQSLRPGESRNEYETILQAIKVTVGDNRALADRLAAAQKERGRALLLRYLNGTLPDPTDLRRRLEGFGIVFEQERFLTAVLWVSGGFPMEEPEKNRALMHFAALNIFEERIGELPEACLADSAEFFVIVAGVASREEYEAALSLLDRTKADALRYAKINVAVSVSGIAESFDDLPDVYQTAVQALRFRMLSDTSSLLVPQSAVAPEKPPVLGVQEEMALLNAVRQGNPESACAIADRVLERIQEEGAPLDLAQCLVFDMISSLIKITHQLPRREDGQVLNQSGYVHRIITSPSLTQTREQVRELIGDLCAAVAAGRSGHSDALREKLTAFIDANLGDPDLGNSLLAETFGISASYLSTFFKEQTGVGLTEHIHRRRVELAKRLLEQSSVRIKDVAAQVGFASELTFMRVFKKYQGMPPSEYRRQLR